jgi:hypothetical protein
LSVSSSPSPFLSPMFMSFSAVGTANILMFDLAVALDRATYNWSCENTGSGKYTPTLGMVYPCALLTVIAKLCRIGNCFHLNWKGNISSSGLNSSKQIIHGGILSSVAEL